jgi:hypothetical protein
MGLEGSAQSASTRSRAPPGGAGRAAEPGAKAKPAQKTKRTGRGRGPQGARGRGHGRRGHRRSGGQARRAGLDRWRPESAADAPWSGALRADSGRPDPAATGDSDPRPAALAGPAGPLPPRGRAESERAGERGPGRAGPGGARRERSGAERAADPAARQAPAQPRRAGRRPLAAVGGGAGQGRTEISLSLSPRGKGEWRRDRLRELQLPCGLRNSRGVCRGDAIMASVLAREATALRRRREHLPAACAPPSAQAPWARGAEAGRGGACARHLLRALSPADSDEHAQASSF